MRVIKLDGKGRLQIPKGLRESLKLKPKESVMVNIKDDSVIIKKIDKKKPEEDVLVRDLLNPGHSRMKVTRKLLEKLEHEMWVS